MAWWLHARSTVTDRPRVIVCLPDPSETTAVADWLSADGFEPVRRPTPQAAADEMRDRPFSLLIADAGFAFRRGLHPQTAAKHAPAIIIGDDVRLGESVNGQTMYLTRPIDAAMLRCFVSMSILDNRPLRRSVRKPVNRFDAVVNGAPSHILDVSAEGLRLEVQSARGATALPPYFTVRLPLVGVAVTVQRMWAHSSPRRSTAVWYGAALAQNRVTTNQAWRQFVDTVPSGGTLEVNP
ncbi:MAG TPA: hypothetical protein VFB92_05375 [Vicinamibacterales bacterium]|nr:hypothetical protein [Vicinamibacterales bacterium]